MSPQQPHEQFPKQVPPQAQQSSDHLWEQGWEGHEDEQLRRLARLSFPEKLAWLEEAQRLVRQIAEGRQREERCSVAKQQP